MNYLVTIFMLCTSFTGFAQFEIVKEKFFNNEFPDSIHYFLPEGTELIPDIFQYFTKDASGNLVLDSSLIYSESTQKFRYFNKIENSYNQDNQIVEILNYTGLYNNWIPYSLDSFYYDEITGFRTGGKTWIYDDQLVLWNLSSETYITSDIIGQDSILISVDQNGDTTFRNDYRLTDDYYSTTTYAYDQGAWVITALDSFAFFDNVHIFTFGYYDENVFYPESVDSIFLNSNKQWHLGYQYYIYDNIMEYVYHKEVFYKSTSSVNENSYVLIPTCSIISQSSSEVIIDWDSQVVGYVQVTNLIGQLVFNEVINPTNHSRIPLTPGINILTIETKNGQRCFSKLVGY